MLITANRTRPSDSQKLERICPSGRRTRDWNHRHMIVKRGRRRTDPLPRSGCLL